MKSFIVSVLSVTVLLASLSCYVRAEKVFHKDHSYTASKCICEEGKNHHSSNPGVDLTYLPSLVSNEIHSTYLSFLPREEGLTIPIPSEGPEGPPPENILS